MCELTYVNISLPPATNLRLFPIYSLDSSTYEHPSLSGTLFILPLILTRTLQGKYNSSHFMTEENESLTVTFS